MKYLKLLLSLVLLVSIISCDTAEEKDKTLQNNIWKFDELVGFENAEFNCDTYYKFNNSDGLMMNICGNSVEWTEFTFVKSATSFTVKKTGGCDESGIGIEVVIDYRINGEKLIIEDPDFEIVFKFIKSLPDLTEIPDIEFGYFDEDDIWQQSTCSYPY
mgnify:CR=1 FL=1